MKWKLTELNRLVMVGVVMAVENYLLLPPSLYLLGLALYVIEVVDDTVQLIEGLDTAPLPTLLIILGVVNFLINWRILQIMGQACRPSRRVKALGHVLVSLVLLLVSTVIVLTASFYCFVQMARLPTVFSGGLNSSMRHYISDADVKARMDILQIDYSCCGDKGYSDWFKTPWVPPDILMGDPKELQTFLEIEGLADFRYVNDDVPFSCCEPSSPRPCVHHHVVVDYLHYKYMHLNNVTLHRRGCRQALMDFVRYALLVPVATSLMLMAVLQLAVLAVSRLTFTSMQKAIEGGNMLDPAEGYIFRPKGPPVSKPARAGNAEMEEKWGLLRDSNDFAEEHLYAEVDEDDAAYPPLHTHSAWGTKGYSAEEGQPLYENVIPDGSGGEFRFERPPNGGETQRKYPFLYENVIPDGSGGEFRFERPPNGGETQREYPLLPSEQAEMGYDRGHDHSQQYKRRSSRAYDSLGIGVPY